MPTIQHKVLYYSVSYCSIWEQYKPQAANLNRASSLIEWGRTFVSWCVSKTSKLWLLLYLVSILTRKHTFSCPRSGYSLLLFQYIARIAWVVLASLFVQGITNFNRFYAWLPSPNLLVFPLFERPLFGCQCLDWLHFSSFWLAFSLFFHLVSYCLDSANSRESLLVPLVLESTRVEKVVVHW